MPIHWGDLGWAPPVGLLTVPNGFTLTNVGFAVLGVRTALGVLLRDMECLSIVAWQKREAERQSHSALNLMRPLF